MLTLRKRANLFALLVIAALLALAVAGAAPVAAKTVTTQAVTWYVAPSGKDTNACNAPTVPCPTINAAVGKAANAGQYSNGDTIKVATGTYTASSGAQVVSLTKKLTLSGGWNNAFTVQNGMSVIDGQGARRGVTILGDLYVKMDHFEVRNGLGGLHGLAGGIYIYWGEKEEGVLLMDHCIVTQNTGGGINAGGSLNIRYSTISENTGGSAIMVTSILGGLIQSSSVDHNMAGGIYAAGGSVSVYNSTISNNVGYGISASVGALVKNSTISGTVAAGDPGAGIIFQGSDGGIGVPADSLNVYNTTVTNNGIGVRVESGTAWLSNSIVAGNSSDGGAAFPDCLGPIGSGGYNIVGSTTGCSFGADPTDKVGTAETPIDAKLAPLANNGGPTLTHGLMAGSPAVDGGNPTVEPGSEGNACLATDQRGVPRPTLAQGVCDVGAYERILLDVSTIQRTDPNPASSAEMHFRVAFNNAVIGVEAGDFVLTTTGDLIGTSIAGVEGSDSNYIVTVNTGSGQGTIRLDLIDDDGILDAYSGEPLGGAGGGNGSFTSSEIYTITGPRVVSITRAAVVNTTVAADVAFIATFSVPVTGVDIVAPFNDFRLTTTGLTGAAILSVTPVIGSDKSYKVSVKRGTGGGTLRLDVFDNDSIVDPTSGRMLGGPGAMNGNFTKGQAYIIAPVPQAPKDTVWDTTPTFGWAKLGGATQYRVQLVNGTTTVYTVTFPATACLSAMCAGTPTKLLPPSATYKWRVQALVGGTWRTYSTWLPFTLMAPTPGLYTFNDGSGGGVRFYVAPDRMSIKNFSVIFKVNGCPNTYMVTKPLVTLNDGGFKFGGAFAANGAFWPNKPSPTQFRGQYIFTSLPIPGCGPVTGYNYFSASWRNSSQPSMAEADELQDAIVVPVPDATIQLFMPMPVVP